MVLRLESLSILKPIGLCVRRNERKTGAYRIRSFDHKHVRVDSEFDYFLLPFFVMNFEIALRIEVMDRECTMNNGSDCFASPRSD